jgi:hypothetical protein
VAVTFGAVAVVSSILLGVLSWQLVQQDRQLDEPRRRGLAEAAADAAAATLAAALNRIETASDGGITRLTIEPTRTSLEPAGSLPFVPTRPHLPEADPAGFAAASALEFAERPDLPRVLATYRTLSASGPPQNRAAALARLAPLLARSGDTSAALRVYEQLDGFDDVAVGGLPASLVGSVGRATLLAKSNQTTTPRNTAAEPISSALRALSTSAASERSNSHATG